MLVEYIISTSLVFWKYLSNVTVQRVFIDGMYMMEVDRVLRPGGYWVLSGPPINWRTNYKAWERPKDDLEEEQRKIEDIAKLLCWEKKSEKGEIAIWRKSVNKESCRERDSRASMCETTNANDVWYIYNWLDNYYKSSSFMMLTAQNNGTFGLHGNVYTIYTI